MRRVLLLAAVAVAIGTVGVVALVAIDGDDDSTPSASTTTTGRAAAAPSPDEPEPSAVPDPDAAATPSTRPRRHAEVESPGAVPIPGALLSEPAEGEPVDVGDAPDCSRLEAGVEPVACLRVDGAGGTFLVFAGRHANGDRQARLYRAVEAGSTSFEPVLETAVLEADLEVFGITLTEQTVDGHPTVVVDYDFNGSGSVHSFDVAAWDEDAPAPTIVAFVGGTGMDRFRQGDDVVDFVSANYDDGAPTCCPNQAEVRTLGRDGPGGWRLESRTVPWSQAP